MARTPARKRPYHHGKLREALLEEAERILHEQGVEGLTLREIARHAGVSHAAAYHHFESREGLVRALAARGFEQLAADLAAGAGRAKGAAGFVEMGVAYVAFAARHPGMFRLMFGPQAAAGRSDPHLRAAADAAFSIVLEGAQGAMADSGPPGSRRGPEVPRHEALRERRAPLDRRRQRPQARVTASGEPRPGGEQDVLRVALWAWSLVHGLASLLLDDLLAHHALSLRDHERIAREVLAARRLL